MANSGRPSVAPARRMFAAILGAIAAFIVLFGLGMGSWAIVALGVALLVLAVSLAVVNVARLGSRAWVDGTAHVVSASEPPASSAYGRCELQIVVDVPGMPAAAIKVRDPRVPVAKWPDAGATLPVSVAIDDLRRVRIRWEDVMTHAEAAAVGADVPPQYGAAARDLLAEDILVQDASPPWATRPEHPWSRDADRPWAKEPDRPWAADRPQRPWSAADPVTADLSDQLGDPDTEPVLVRDNHGGPIVLEGTLVDSGTGPSPLPRRSRPRPRPRRSPETRPGGDGPSTDGPPAQRSAGADLPLTDSPVTTGTDLPPEPGAAGRT